MPLLRRAPTSLAEARPQLGSLGRRRPAGHRQPDHAEAGPPRRRVRPHAARRVSLAVDAARERRPGRPARRPLQPDAHARRRSTSATRSRRGSGRAPTTSSRCRPAPAPTSTRSPTSRTTASSTAGPDATTVRARGGATKLGAEHLPTDRHPRRPRRRARGSAWPGSTSSTRATPSPRDDLDAAVEAAGLTVEPGDVVLRPHRRDPSLPTGDRAPVRHGRRTGRTPGLSA